MQFEEKCDYIFNSEKDQLENKDEDISPKLKQSIKDIVKKEGYVEYNIDFKCLPADGGNYMARLIEINVNGVTENEKKKTDIFVKHCLPGELFTLFSITEAYCKEVFAYTELLKIYDKLQIEAKIPKNERLSIVKSYEESSNEFIILENITKKGFSSPNRLEPISFEFAKLSIEQLAKFHGLSFVLQKKEPEYFNNKVKCHKPSFNFNDDWNKFIENFVNISMGTLDDDMKKKVKKLIPTILEKFRDYQLNRNTLCCLSHGDFRANNIMMKLNDDKIEEVILIDFQLIHYGSPLNDFFFFIFGATDQQLRKDHLEDLKDIYHNTLGNFLQYFDMDVNDYFPRKTFEKLYKERLEYGLLTAVWFLPIVLTDSEDIPDYSKQSPTDVTFKVDKCFKERLEGVLHDYIEWGYL